MIVLRKFIKEFEAEAGKAVKVTEKKERLKRGDKKIKNLQSMVFNLSSKLPGEDMADKANHAAIHHHSEQEVELCLDEPLPRSKLIILGKRQQHG